MPPQKAPPRRKPTAPRKPPAAAPPADPLAFVTEHHEPNGPATVRLRLRVLEQEVPLAFVVPGAPTRPRRLLPALHQPVEQLQATHVGHAHVQQQTAGLAGRGLQQGLLQCAGAVEHLAGQAPRPQQPGQRIAHAHVIVDHVHHSIFDRLHGLILGAASAANARAGRSAR